MSCACHCCGCCHSHPFPILSSDSQSSDPTVDSDEEKESSKKVKNKRGKSVNANRSAAAIKRGELGRDSDVITIHEARRAKFAQLPQVLNIVANMNKSWLSIVVVSVIQEIMNTPSRRRHNHTTVVLKQVPAGTPGSKSITAFRVTNVVSKLVPFLTKRRKSPSSGKMLEPLFKWDGPATFNGRMVNFLKFKQIYGLETNEAGTNIGWHDLNKETYSDDMVFLYGHRLLEGRDNDKIAKIVNLSTDKNPDWSFEDL